MPETLKQILQEIAIGAIVGAIAAVVWVFVVGSAQASPWTFFVVNVVVLLAAGCAASAWSHWQSGRRSKGAGR
ncbi:hypothetical protein [Streptomyces angustmyceticus]|uniref:hypothetical protein n=1 Tax=Streptomyces angustmyceticus TaxID=285578 RepID=UPI0034508E27